MTETDDKKLSELGFNGHRLSENPQEEKCLEIFARRFQGKYAPNQMDYMVFGQKGSSPKGFLTDREKQIIFSTIQWLGSHVGQSYLRDCGYELKRK